MKTYRLSQQLLFLISTLVLALSFYLQYFQDLEPCPLCMMQRVCVIFFVIFTLLGCFTERPNYRFLLSIFELIIGLAGVYFAARQVWLQSLPVDAMPACLPGLSVLMHYFPWQQILQALIWGSAECGEVTWQALGFTLPQWSLLYFLAALIMVTVGHFRSSSL